MIAEETDRTYLSAFTYRFVYGVMMILNTNGVNRVKRLLELYHVNGEDECRSKRLFPVWCNGVERTCELRIPSFANKMGETVYFPFSIEHFEE